MFIHYEARGHREIFSSGCKAELHLRTSYRNKQVYFQFLPLFSHSKGKAS
jgi:hypothetical protein